MSDWEDEPKQKPVVAELWRESNSNAANTDDGWGNETWTVSEGNRAYKDTDRRHAGNSNRFDDQDLRQDDTMWGGGSSNIYNGVKAAHGIIPRPNRGVDDKRDGVHGINDRMGKNAIVHNERQGKDDIGFGYDNSGYSGPNNGKYQNGHAARKFFSTNFSSGVSSTAAYSFGNKATGRHPKSGDRGCYNCGESGHIARNCRTGADTRAIGEDGCFKCGEDGHFARECVNTSSGFVSRNRLGGGGYVPREEADFDVLYQNGISSGINFERCVK